jgi:hypothetical protein
MESLSECGSEPSVAEFMGRAILIVSANKQCFECLTELQRRVIIKSVEPKDRYLGNTRRHIRGCQIKTVDSDKRITTQYITMQPTDITTREPVRTELI